uniref:Uncharacterized protein n=1 Tax=Arundo donax TaxID=35708 RepID=A0A0A9B4U7_ARUDO
MRGPAGLPATRGSEVARRGADGVVALWRARAGAWFHRSRGEVRARRRGRHGAARVLARPRHRWPRATKEAPGSTEGECHRVSVPV